MISKAMSTESFHARRLASYVWRQGFYRRYQGESSVKIRLKLSGKRKRPGTAGPFLRSYE
jgi:hypothetical protein